LKIIKDFSLKFSLKSQSQSDGNFNVKFKVKRLVKFYQAFKGLKRLVTKFESQPKKEKKTFCQVKKTFYKMTRLAADCSKLTKTSHGYFSRFPVMHGYNGQIFLTLI
jgi:hypothetical protein